MISEDPIINRVAKSPIITINLEEYLPKEEKVNIDLKDNLFQGLILREKDFREFIKETNWEEYKNKIVGIHCSEEVVIPTWAFMLISSALQPYAKKVYFGYTENLQESLLLAEIEAINIETFRDKPVVIKGCSNLNISPYPYIKLIQKIQPVVKSILYGEPCSAVPVFKRKKEK